MALFSSPTSQCFCHIQAIIAQSWCQSAHINNCWMQWRHCRSTLYRFKTSPRDWEPSCNITPPADALSTLLTQRLSLSLPPCSACQQQLPATGVPITRQRFDHMRQKFREYVQAQTLQNWKFWIVSWWALNALNENMTQIIQTSEISGSPCIHHLMYLLVPALGSYVSLSWSCGKMSHRIELLLVQAQFTIHGVHYTLHVIMLMIMC